MNANFGWIGFYTTFADTLLPFKNNRKALIKKIQNAYTAINMKLPTLDKNGAPKDIDPFTIYGLFNKGIKKATRKTIIGALKSEFAVDADVPDDFAGLPVVMNMAATFYTFDDSRGEHDIDTLWDVFESAIALAKSKSTNDRERFCRAYDNALAQAGVRWNLTIGIYWIRPYDYLSLDSRNRWYMENPQNISTDIVDEVKDMKDIVPAGYKYLEIRDKCLSALESGKYGYDSFPALSYKAWVVSNEANQSRDDESANTPSSLGDADVDSRHIWLYAPGEGAKMWENFYSEGIMALGWGAAGDLTQYESKEDIKKALQERQNPDFPFTHPKRMLWQFVHEMTPGDIVFAKKGRSEIVGRGVVESAYIYDPSGDRYPNVRKVKWTHKGHWDAPEMMAMQTLTDLTNYTETVSKISAIFATEDDNDDCGEQNEKIINYPVYTRKDFLNEVYLDENAYNTLVYLLESEKNVILEGAPGVGKTFIAKRLAYSIMGVKDAERVMMVQFHQSYSYEDFIMGIRPTSNGFEIKKGVFYNFCKKAEDDSENSYFFIIDEINRGNLSKIFGELFVLIENDKRGSRNKIQLLYSDEMFFVPENVYIIGMMNTADRSLAMMDYALRRRFGFFTIYPAFSSERFNAYRKKLGIVKFDKLIATVEDLNRSIKEDESLGDGFCIGHSYFCNFDPNVVTDQKFSILVEHKILPMLKEYWFDEPSKIKEWSDKLRSAIQ